MSRFRNACILASFTIFALAATLPAAEKIAVSILANDVLVIPNHSVSVAARIISNHPTSSQDLGGEPLELVRQGVVVATSTTKSDGTVLFEFIPKARETVGLTVRPAAGSRLAPVEASLTLAAWERRRPIITVEFASLVAASSAAEITLAQEAVWDPMPDAAEQLDKVTQYYYNIVYVVTNLRDQSQALVVEARIRQWLKDHRFPAGYVLVLPDGEDSLGTTLDHFHASGWTTMKTGVGRTKAFAEAFLQRRLEAVMVPEPEKGEAPRKAKIAKEWKEIRKKL